MKKYIILLIILAVAQLGYCQYMGSDDLITKTDSISKVSSVDFAYEGIFPPYTPNWQDDSLATHQQIANYFDILSGSYNSASFTVMAGYPKLVLGKVKPENFAGQGLSIPAASETQFGIMSFFHFSKLDTLFDDLTTNYLTKYNGTGLVNTNVQENATGVGIGKKPEYKLDVSGNINFDNNLYKNGVLIDFSSLFDTVQVGDIFGGGMVFYMDPSKKWGLTVATTYLDILPAGLSDVNPGPVTLSALGTGLDNTLNIVDYYGTSGNNYAALCCLNSNYNGFSDWYLPSLQEADSIYVNLRATGKIGYMDDFWTSTTVNRTEYYFNMYRERDTGGSQSYYVSGQERVYPIRKFTIDEAAADFSYPSGRGIVTVNGGNQWGTTITDNSNNWNTAYNDKINSLAVTGTTTKTITLTQQDGGTITGSFTDISGEGGGSDYTLPEASSTVLGGVKIAVNGGFLPNGPLVQADRYLTTDTPVSTDWIGFGDVSSGFNKKCTIADLLSLGGSGGSMVYPSSGIPLSTGSAWGTSITNNSSNWNTAYNDKVNSLAVTGTTTKTITLTQQDGGTVSGTFTDLQGSGTSPWTSDTYGINYQDGNVGIGTGAISSLRLYVNNVNTAIKGLSTDGYGLEGYSNTSTGVYGYSNGDYGLMGVSSANHAVFGSCTFTNTTKYAGFFSGGIGVNSQKGYSVNEVEVIDDQGVFIPAKIASAPTTPVAGMIYFNTNDKHFYGYNGTTWKQLDN